MDEVQFADPAVSLVRGEGFTSTAWFAQDSQAFWAGNVPLYTILLSCWFWLLGVSPAVGRSFNLVLFLAFLWVAWTFLKRSALVSSENWRLGFIALLICAHGLVFSYRAGRYDSLGMLWFALSALVWTIAPGVRRTAALILLGALMPWTGLQLLPAAGLLGALLLLFLRREALTRVAAVWTGVLLGCATLWWFYASHGVWSAFRASTSAIGVIGHSWMEKLQSLPAVYTADKTRLIVLVLALALAWLGRRNRPFLFGLSAALLFPAAMQIAGKFPIYYGWMALLPLMIGVFGLLAAEFWRISSIQHTAAVATLTAAALIGLPIRLWALAAGAADRSPAAVSAFVRAHVRPDDVAVADFKVYYALRELTLRPLAITYLPAIRPEERDRVTVLIVKPQDAQAVQQVIGGHWLSSGTKPAPRRSNAVLALIVKELRDDDYPLLVYRREPLPGAAPSGPASP
ncbi:MAG: hypothetical protein IPP47_05195 [Bryobacterales bacterium]|nr:hypothetical protein [Bryobacterales bacterium]